jgi:hypothetical protein
MMKTYIGCKVIAAELATGKSGEPGYRVVYPTGYESWSPKAVFEAAYREIGADEVTIIDRHRAG